MKWNTIGEAFSLTQMRCRPCAFLVDQCICKTRSEMQSSSRGKRKVEAVPFLPPPEVSRTWTNLDHGHTLIAVIS